jgi:hypothetical protein
MDLPRLPLPPVPPQPVFTADNTYYVQSGIVPTSYTTLISQLSDVDKPALTDLVNQFLAGTDNHDQIEAFLIDKGLIQDLRGAQ